MTEDASRWKEKYLQALEEQERQDERWRTRLDLLRRSLVRSSLAVEGADKAVDDCMAEMREVLRQDDLDQGLTRLVPRLEKAVLDSERHRHTRVEQMVEALQRLATQLQALPVPPEVRKSLKRFAKSLEARAAQTRELPALLGELGGLQEQALAVPLAGQAERGGLLSRLFGPRAAATPEQAVDHVAAVETEQVGQTAVAALDSALAQEAVAEPVALAAGDTPSPVAPDDPAFALPASPEPGYSAIAERVEVTLRGLLDELPLPEHQRPRAEALRARISEGLNWYELVPVLDDLAMLMLAVADLSQREFERYLQQLNERLSTLQDNLQVAREGHAQNQAAADALDAELREQVGGLQDSMQHAPDLHSLKLAVESRLEGLLGTVDAYRRQRSENEQALGERLAQLSERVATMEEAAGQMREHLEEQRQKALHDPLTGLPNRAAWDERLMLEVARWQRYGNPLVLAVLDIDHFKRINDGFGHLAGDRVLKIVANELRKRIRKTDFLARFGGEEFALLVTETGIEGAEALLETLRDGIAACPFHFKGERTPVTFSAGMSAFAGSDTPAAVFERADQALYRAKQAGRNRIEAG